MNPTTFILLSSQRHSVRLLHLLRKTGNAGCFYALNTFAAVCPGDKTDRFRKKIVILFALHERDYRTLRTSCVAVLYTAFANFTPSGLFVALATGAFPFFELAACSAIEAAVGNMESFHSTICKLDFGYWPLSGCFFVLARSAI